MSAPHFQETNKTLEFIESLRKRTLFLINLFRVREGVTFFLSRFPMTLTKDHQPIRIRCWSDILAYTEIFHVGIYDKVFEKLEVRTLLDLGCQSGMTLMRLASKAKRPIQGILIDANPLAIQRCQSNIASAGLEGVHVFFGAVGCALHAMNSEKTMASFVVRPNELESSLSDYGSKAKEVSIEVPVLNVHALWEKQMGEQECDLLKIDIEGAEEEFLRSEQGFLRKTKACLVEWHSPHSTSHSLEISLRAAGFTHFEVQCEGEKSGVLFAWREA